eukprot:TRINITY_DN2052_c0_g1_i11.p1 TRINITY_DN2052_c0_g1~~TRINITY_DN2052_c0_g1_i11.p1  ORF type:complete len:223 (-),score=48.47 TRINITY_DN2052_c0_g1_i11:118-786(-)
MLEGMPSDRKKPHRIPPLLLRAMGLATSLAILVHSLLEFHSLLVTKFVDYIAAYTQWGLTMSILLFALLVATELVPCLSSKLRNFAGTFTEVVWCAQVVIVVIFWLLLAVIGSLYCSNNCNLTCSRVMFFVEVHSLPALFVFLEARNSGLQFAPEHKLYTYIPLVSYGTVAFLLAHTINVSRYPVFDFKDWKSVVFSVFACLLNEFGFYLGRTLSKTKSKLK